MDKKILQKAQQWLIGNFDAETKAEVRNLLENNEQELIDSFYKDLQFGTGGLRGKMGVGTNRMNIYTVGKATLALALYLKKSFPGQNIKVAIAYDSRKNSDTFAHTAANILSNNNITVYIFDDIRPTPELSFAIRYLKCHAGIVITASHNPKEYNGFKVYWNDGAQIIAPHDKNIMEIMQSLSYDQISFTPNNDIINTIGHEIDEQFIKLAHQISINPTLIKKNHDLKIVYTPLHGTGIKLIPQTLKSIGFSNIFIVEEQAVPDGNFPTVKSPNPEDPQALTLALKKAKQINADIILASDPDADRLAVGIKDKNNTFILLNGNQVSAILAYYILDNLSLKQKLPKNAFIVKTIVTSNLLKNIAKYYNVSLFETLTGFKYIAALIRQWEGKKKFILGCEESFGYLATDQIRDKDSVTSAALISEIAAWAKNQNLSLYDILIQIYKKFGLFKEKLINIIMEGKEGEEKRQKLMDSYRHENLTNIAGTPIIKKIDYLLQTITSLPEKKTSPLTGFPKSNVIQFLLQDNTLISIRPSGTEPKIKYYFSVSEKITDKKGFAQTDKALDKRLEKYISFFKSV